MKTLLLTLLLTMAGLASAQWDRNNDGYFAVQRNYALPWQAKTPEALPTEYCPERLRGIVDLVYGKPGEADRLRVCVKNSRDEFIFQDVTILPKGSITYEEPKVDSLVPKTQTYCDMGTYWTGPSPILK